MENFACVSMDHGTHPERFGDWYDYLKRERSKARYMGLQQEFISPQEVARRHPLIDPKHYYAATRGCPRSRWERAYGVIQCYPVVCRTQASSRSVRTPVRFAGRRVCSGILVSAGP